MSKIKNKKIIKKSIKDKKLKINHSENFDKDDSEKINKKDLIELTSNIPEHKDGYKIAMYIVAGLMVAIVIGAIILGKL